MKYKDEWVTEFDDRFSAPCDVKVSKVLEVSSNTVRLDDDIANGWYFIPEDVGPVSVGQLVIARIPWDGCGYIELLKDGDA